MENVKLTTSRYGHKETRTFRTIQDALETMSGEVEENLAAPILLEVPATVIGGGTVRFDSLQIYLMLTLLNRAADVV